ncbi:hypothetical protein MNEG_14900 [Monoraphidium neglectum]|uniref:Uncharacterized protein n=1 Tax=Monoraphidium neglectum TaxID=145388 RepID=A0A0D2IYV9_9CHLO|nr:hypothetical protein MNEG_14900 [Monoraphidium neglectum]KIY93062.1 hypothetical protein MNEG_14900 [Monoraphidium neglectum]|eukprot:XP_013892082.1 hypothetical protein MNEG_14900 [Monoraphidium neglectum]
MDALEMLKLGEFDSQSNHLLFECVDLYMFTKSGRSVSEWFDSTTRVFKDQEAVAVAFDDVISAVYCK